MILSAIIGIIFAFATFNTDQAIIIIAIFVAFFALGLIFLGLGQLRERGLVRLRAEGTAYDADSIDYAPVYFINVLLARDYLFFRARFGYTDHGDATRTTRTRWYAVKLDKTETYFTPLDHFGFVAKVYVNPANGRDYAVELHMD